MKKSTILIIFVLAAMILGVVASASAMSTNQAYADGANAIDKIRVALDKGNKSKAEEGLAELRTAVYGGMTALAAKGEYSDELNNCLNYATQAVNGASNWWELLDLALTALKNALMKDTVPVVVVPPAVTHS